MEKEYIAIYNCKEYTIQDIEDMIEVYNVKYWHCPQTWETPEEEDIDYKFDVNSNFDKAVKIACVEFEDDNDEFGRYVEFDGVRLRLRKEGYSWFDLLQSFGWDIFEGISNLEDFQDSDIKVRINLDNWINSIAENKALEILENEKYGDF